MRPMTETAPTPRDPWDDTEWLKAVNEKLKPHGAKKALADKLGVSAAMITRMAQGRPTKTGVIWRASVELGINPPATMPFDDLQQRTMRALTHIRSLVTDRQAAAVVARFEAEAARIADIWRDFFEAHARAVTAGTAAPREPVRQLVARLSEAIGEPVTPNEVGDLWGKMIAGRYHEEDDDPNDPAPDE